VRIAVLSDTHDRMPAGLAAKFASADEIWHLGDICTPAILEILRTVGLPLRFVRGNCDAYEEWPLTLDFELEGFRIHLEHIPPSAAPAGVDLVLHGHTHVPCDHTISGCRYLNPGCISRPNRGAPASFATLTVHPNTEILWQLHKFQA